MVVLDVGVLVLVSLIKKEANLSAGVMGLAVVIVGDAAAREVVLASEE